MEGRWNTGRKIHQMWAEWAVHHSCYLQKGSLIYLDFYKNIPTDSRIKRISGQILLDFSYVSLHLQECCEVLFLAVAIFVYQKRLKSILNLPSQKTEFDVLAVWDFLIRSNYTTRCLGMCIYSTARAL